MAVNQTAAIIVASGRGVRAGVHAEGPKQFRTIGGRSVLERTVTCFADHPEIGLIVLVIHPDDRGRVETLFANDGISAKLRIVDGGPIRQASVRNGLAVLDETDCDRVLIHDGVRPFVTADTISRVLEAVTADQGALPVIPVADTLKRGRDNYVAETVDRTGLFAAQTPQGFPLRPIRKAHEAATTDAAREFTDDASIAEWAGLPIRFVAGEPDNIKLTSARDIELADQRLAVGYKP